MRWMNWYRSGLRQMSNYLPVSIQEWQKQITKTDCYVYETRDEIPRQSPGVYAWYLRLDKVFFNCDTLCEFIKTAKSFYLYDANHSHVGVWNRQVDMPFANNNSIDISVRFRLEESDIKNKSSYQSNVRLWDRLKSDEDAYKKTTLLLAQASLSLPPLYTGKAKDMYVRYMEHIDRDDMGTFRSRFRSYVQDLGGQYNMRHLIFRCICCDYEPLGESTATKEEERAAPEVSASIEDILHQIFMPSFSIM